jgi:putative aldouronate transport system permease protein
MKDKFMLELKSQSLESQPLPQSGFFQKSLSWLPKPIRQNGMLFLMAAPALIWLVLFSYVPMAGLVIAFQDYRFDKGILHSAWVGFSNFRFLVSTGDGIRMTVNTLGLNAIFIASEMAGSILVAIFLYHIQRHFLSRYYQSALFFPYFISWVIVGVFVYALLNADTGLVNQLLKRLGLSTIPWYSSPEYWPAILTLVNLWKSVGFWSLIYFAGLMAISPEIYEAAEVDGANPWQQTIFITLPLLAPLVIINVLLCIGRIFYADFGLFFQVPRDQGLLYSTTDVIDTYVFRALRRTGKIGMASAAGFYQAVVGFTLVLISNLIVWKIDRERSLF